MVDVTVGILCCFTEYNSSEARFLWKASEITGVALIAIPTAFIVPAVFNLHRQSRLEDEEQEALLEEAQREEDEREAKKQAALNRSQRARARRAGSRS